MDLPAIAHTVLNESELPELFNAMNVAGRTIDGGISLLRAFESVCFIGELMEKLDQYDSDNIINRVHDAMTSSDVHHLIRFKLFDYTLKNINQLKTDLHRIKFQKMLGAVLDVLHSFVTQSDELNILVVIEIVLRDIGKIDHTFYKQQLQRLALKAIEASENNGFSVVTTIGIVDFLVGFSEVNGLMLEDVGLFVVKIFDIMQSRVTQNFEDIYNSDQFMENKEYFERLSSNSLYRYSVVETVANVFHNNMNENVEWQKKFVALIAFRDVSKDSIKVVKFGEKQTKVITYRELDTYLTKIVEALGHDAPKVRWAALACIQRMCRTFKGVIQEQRAQLLFEPICQRLHDMNQNVQEQAMLTLRYFPVYGHPDFLVPYMTRARDALLESYENVNLDSKPKAVQALTAWVVIAAYSPVSEFNALLERVSPIEELMDGRGDLPDEAFYLHDELELYREKRMSILPHMLDLIGDKWLKWLEEIGPAALNNWCGLRE
ncbi:importin subunit beta-3-like protein [Tanacetum coccineum]